MYSVNQLVVYIKLLYKSWQIFRYYTSQYQYNKLSSFRLSFCFFFGDFFYFFLLYKAECNLVTPIFSYFFIFFLIFLYFFVFLVFFSVELAFFRFCIFYLLYVLIFSMMDWPFSCLQISHFIILFKKVKEEAVVTKFTCIPRTIEHKMKNL